MKILRKPEWLKRKLLSSSELGNVIKTLEKYGLNTVCLEAKCPNRNICYANGQATFLIMGDVCTRSCRFCAILSGKPKSLDPDEPHKIAKAVRDLGLSYVVITSVTRDDLPDGGAFVFAEVVIELRNEIPGIRIEILTPDFKGDHKALDTVLKTNPDVFNHNIETVSRLYSKVRPQADYSRSLNVLKYVSQKYDSIIKSGFMVGLGETDEEIFELMRDLKASGVQVLTIGQYLQPSSNHLPVERYVTPNQFKEYENFGENHLQFIKVFAGPLVRSSFMAKDIWQKISISN